LNCFLTFLSSLVYCFHCRNVREDVLATVRSILREGFESVIFEARFLCHFFDLLMSLCEYQLFSTFADIVHRD